MYVKGVLIRIPGSRAATLRYFTLLAVAMRSPVHAGGDVDDVAPPMACCALGYGTPTTGCGSNLTEICSNCCPDDPGLVCRYSLQPYGEDTSAFDCVWFGSEEECDSRYGKDGATWSTHCPRTAADVDDHHAEGDDFFDDDMIDCMRGCPWWPQQGDHADDTDICSLYDASSPCQSDCDDDVEKKFETACCMNDCSRWERLTRSCTPRCPTRPPTPAPSAVPSPATTALPTPRPTRHAPPIAPPSLTPTLALSPEPSVAPEVADDVIVEDDDAGAGNSLLITCAASAGALVCVGATLVVARVLSQSQHPRHWQHRCQPLVVCATTAGIRLAAVAAATRQFLDRGSRGGGGSGGGCRDSSSDSIHAGLISACGEVEFAQAECGMY